MEAIQGPIDHLEWKPPGRVAFTSVQILSFVTGEPFDDRVLGLMAAFQPSCVRVITDPGRKQLDQVPWRVSVFLKDGLIESITQEVQIGLPKRFANLDELKASLK